MKRRDFMFGAVSTIGTASTAWADCESSVILDTCLDVGDRKFQPGTVQRPADCSPIFRLPPDIHEAIVLQNGSFEWVLRLATFSGRSVRWTQAHTIQNTPERQQGIFFGTHAFVYVTCRPYYVGWLTTGAINTCAPNFRPEFQRVTWNVTYQELDELEAKQRRKS